LVLFFCASPGAPYQGTGVCRGAARQCGALLNRKRDRICGRPADAFVTVMGVPQPMRGLADEPVLHFLAAAELELWADTASRAAYRDIAAAPGDP
jgi:hypothetical protein